MHLAFVTRAITEAIKDPLIFFRFLVENCIVTFPQSNISESGSMLSDVPSLSLFYSTLINLFNNFSDAFA